MLAINKTEKIQSSSFIVILFYISGFLPNKIGSFLSGPTTKYKIITSGRTMFTILDFLIFKMSISQPFEELQGWNAELKLITPISISGSYF